MVASPLDDVLISSALYRGLVVRYLERHPALVDALRAAAAHVVVFDIPDALEPDEIFHHTQGILDGLDATLTPSAARPVYLAWGSVPSLYKTGAFREGAAPLPVRPRRGVFAGFLATGEGGLAFFGADGVIRSAEIPPRLALDWIRAASSGSLT